ncbi:MAG: hypothetical protein DHS20C21_24120 [Gemmatimonadota bacterium]|nr:MAG: hypothetical protein DHS20C21_24120 [Gemmatimonadota bacterium]
MSRRKVLFLCTGNSCRSQMAEGWARHLLADSVRAYSAGVETHGLNSRAVAVMAEAGVDISGQESQHVDSFLDLEPDLVVTVCDHAAEVCPVLPGAQRTIHHQFEDPAKATGDEEQVLEEFRRVRDEIREFVRGLPELLEDGDRSPDAWEHVGEEAVSEHGIFRLKTYDARSPRTGKARPFTVIETPDWVNVVAVTQDDEFVLVRQYRHGRDEVTLEIPGGIIDPGEDPARAAARELEEETGWTGDIPALLGVVDSNPAILSNRCFTYLIRNCERTSDMAQDPGEDIQVVTLGSRDVAEAIASGGITHALVLCAFAWYRQQQPDGAPEL